MKWSNRFSKKIDRNFSNYNSSFKYDKKLFKEEIKCIKEHSKMLFEIKIISKKEITKIKKCLMEIKKNFKKYLSKDNDFEDIHMAIERIIIKKIGKAGEKIRTARSRNDLVTTDLRMWIMRKNIIVIKEIKKIIILITNKAKKNISTIMPGFTHFQIAQPVSLAHHFMSYVEMFVRDIKRLKSFQEIINEMPLGCCALAGTSFNIKRKKTSKRLGFKRICRNSIDAVSDRDYVLDLLYAYSIFMMHISRICEEMIIWSNNMFEFIEISDSISSGSSIMPQKKNPDILEILRSKVGLIYGSLTSFFIIMKSLVQAYNKDYQEDKKIIFNAFKTVRETIEIIKIIIKNIKIRKKKMLKASKMNYSVATDIAEYLVKEGVTYIKAYKAVSKMVGYCIKKGMKEISLKTCKKFIKKKYVKGLKNNNILLSKNSVKNKISKGGTGYINIIKEIKKIKERLNKI